MNSLVEDLKSMVADIQQKSIHDGHTTLRNKDIYEIISQVNAVAVRNEQLSKQCKEADQCALKREEEILELRGDYVKLSNVIKHLVLNFSRNQDDLLKASMMLAMASNFDDPIEYLVEKVEELG